MDFKRAAAGETEADQSPNPFISEMLKKLNESNKRYAHDLAFLEGALDLVVNQTQAKLTEESRLEALIKLSTFPKWKLLRLIDFNEPYMREVWKYLDNIRYDESHTHYKAPLELPEPPTGIAKDCMEYVSKIIQEEYARTPEGDKLEREFVEMMTVKHPRVKWMCGRKGNKVNWKKSS